MITATILTCNELNPLKRCLESIQNYVDDIIIGVDSKTIDGTQDYLNGKYKFDVFEFKDFSKARNDLIEKVKTPWYLVIDSDETMLEKHASKIKDLLKEGDRRGVDTFTMGRKHWFDLEMTKEWIPFAYIDKHFRIMRKHLRYFGKVHESIQDAKRISDCELWIQHFNMFYRTAEDWKAKNEFYQELGKNNG